MKNSDLEFVWVCVGKQERRKEGERWRGRALLVVAETSQKFKFSSYEALIYPEVISSEKRITSGENSFNKVFNKVQNPKVHFQWLDILSAAWLMLTVFQACFTLPVTHAQACINRNTVSTVCERHSLNFCLCYFPSWEPQVEPTVINPAARRQIMLAVQIKD